MTEPADRPLLVLVHSPLIGPATWDALVPALREHGFDTVVPDLTGALTAGPPYWPKQVDAVAKAVPGRSAALVGHSGAGPLLPAMGDRLHDAAGGVGGYVYVDAGLPQPGVSWLESVPAELANHLRSMESEGWLPPWPQWWEPAELRGMLPDAGVREHFTAACPALPLAMFEEAGPPSAEWPSRPSAYLRLSEAYEQPAEQARGLGWPVVELPSHHLGVLTDPHVVADAVAALVARLGASGPPAS